MRFLFTLFLLFSFTSTWAIDRTQRMGLGLNNQFRNNLPALSLKVQSTPQTSYALLAGISTSDTAGGFGFGGKFYKTYYEEPHLNFYGVFTLALLNTKTATTSTSGMQIEAGAGTEFSIPGLESVGFSFEFGLSLNKTSDSMSFETFGDPITRSSIHFYL